MGLLDLKQNYLSEYISISFAVHLIYEATDCLDEELEEYLKLINIKSLPIYQFDTRGDTEYEEEIKNLIFRSLDNLSKDLGNFFTSCSLEYWKRSDFFNFPPIKRLNLREGKEWVIDAELLTNTLSATQDCQQFPQPQADIKALQSENQALKQRIAELEAKQQATTQPQQAGIFELITDETHAHYAPDLAHAVNLWHSIYIQNPKNDSHNNKANTWIKNNTPYSGGQEDTATRRIREITTPYSDWHPSRRN